MGELAYACLYLQKIKKLKHLKNEGLIVVNSLSFMNLVLNTSYLKRLMKDGLRFPKH